MQKSDLKILRATTKNADEIASLFNSYREFYKQKSDLKSAKNFISQRLKNKDSIIFIAKTNHQIVGFVQLFPAFSSIAIRSILILNDLYVATSARKLGIGKQLMNKAKDYATKNKIKRLVLATAKTNREAKSLYESLGYTIDKVYYHYSLEI